MQLALTGANVVGKSTTLNAFLNRYPKYGTPSKTYRDIPNLKLRELATQDSQALIRDFMFDQAKDQWARRDTIKHVFNDRSLLDNMAVTMYLYMQGKVTDEFFTESLEMTKKAMGFYHIIYFIPLRPQDKYPIPEGLDMDFRGSLDIILNSYFDAYSNRDDERTKTLFPEKNCTSFLKIEGTTEERLSVMGWILDSNGDLRTDTPEMPDLDEPTIYGANGMEVNQNTFDCDFEVHEDGQLVEKGLIVDGF